MLARLDCTCNIHWKYTKSAKSVTHGREGNRAADLESEVFCLEDAGKCGETNTLFQCGTLGTEKAGKFGGRDQMATFVKVFK